MSKPIGGFIEWEDWKDGKGPYHKALELASGRSAFRLILDQCKPDKVYVPFFCCDSLIQPLEEAGTAFEFYEIGYDLLPNSYPKLKANELIVYIDFYGISRRQSRQMEERYGEQLVLDLTMAFFRRPSSDQLAFNSCRKFFGVPDGAYLYGIESDVQLKENQSFTTNHLHLRSKGDLPNAYPEFLKNEGQIPSKPLSMSEVSREVMAAVDYGEVAKRRSENFEFLHHRLRKDNNWSIPDLEGQVPLYYPYRPSSPIDRKNLITEQVFLATIWPDVLNRNVPGFHISKQLSAETLPLPIDQRYGPDDLERMLELLEKEKHV
jgi:hypothetical protein